MFAFELLWKGAVIGFAIAAPVGPIGLLCIRRTLSDGRLAGFVSGLGAAGADTVFGLIAALGLTLIGPFLQEHKNTISVVGGLFLLYLGYVEIRAKPVDPSAPPPRPTGLVSHFVSTFCWTLANPMTILSFIAIFTGLDVAGPGGLIGPAERDYPGVTALIIGVFCGSSLWWLVLSLSVGLFRHHIRGQPMRWPNLIAGTLIIFFGLYALTAVRYML
ncbi:MAG TPA: LysE family transporter [Methylomirabilota bacterium]|nr:LysE family transporter [Methylomirabilota bacterium]